MAVSPAPSQTKVRPLGRAVTSVSRNGVRGTAQRLHRWVITPLWRRIHLREEHVWFTVPFWPEGAPMPDGYVMRRGGMDDLEALAAIGSVSPEVGQRYLDRGARLYVAYHGDDLAFATWIHTGTVPVLAARGGELRLPDGMISFEDSIAAPAHRRGTISGAVIREVTAREQRTGAEAIITRVAVENRAARKWALRMGSTPVATVRLRRTLGWQRVDVESLPGGEAVAELLSERL